ncbi:MAG TPA: TolC family protein [Spirochaetota bacterium]|nr:TolC family protein [Spirochaetota bacterium]HPJ35541.1 TolC family protein [Spirochaetota bacterium]
MRFRIIAALFFVSLTASALFSEENIAVNGTISYENYIAAVEKTLPELKSNEVDVLSAENAVKSAKSGGDTALTAGGTSYSNKQYSGINNKGDVRGYDYYAGLSKTITSTGTTLSGTYNYEKNSYSNFNSSSDYSSYAPSFSVKVSQPLLYNFFGKVDRYSENNAKMKLEIAKSQLQENNKSVLNAYKKLYFQWIMYSENIKNLDAAVVNSNALKNQILRKVRAGLADNDDYQGAVSSVLSYENQRREYRTELINIENQMSLYLDITGLAPDEKAFEDYYGKAGSSDLAEVDFKKTTSAKVMDLTMKNYLYSKGVYENRLLPEFNIFGEVTRKDLSDSQTYGTRDTDYSVGFEFKYYLENNSAESGLKDVEIQIKGLEYEYEATENSYRKQLLSYIESSKGIIDQLENKEKALKALQSKLVTEKRKYSQARLNLSYVISTENSITSEKNNILSLKYQLISCYIDYMDLVK